MTRPRGRGFCLDHTFLGWSPHLKVSNRSKASFFSRRSYLNRKNNIRNAALCTQCSVTFNTLMESTA